MTTRWFYLSLALLFTACSTSQTPMRTLASSDNELPAYGGSEVRATAAEFAQEITAHHADFFSENTKPFGSIRSRIDH
jgi:hypothetical protein